MQRAVITKVDMPFAESLPTSGIVILSGPSGSGKTRRMQDAARQFAVQKGHHLLHCCVLDLIQEMSDVINRGAFETFHASLMRFDAMFIDNIWLLQRRPNAAGMLFPLFEAFADKGGWVMMADDLSPSLFLKWASKR
jgi:chromosomal replication initiation ATPase DnaA